MALHVPGTCFAVPPFASTAARAAPSFRRRASAPVGSGTSLVLMSGPGPGTSGLRPPLPARGGRIRQACRARGRPRAASSFSATSEAQSTSRTFVFASAASRRTSSNPERSAPSRTIVAHTRHRPGPTSATASSTSSRKRASVPSASFVPRLTTTTGARELRRSRSTSRPSSVDRPSRSWASMSQWGSASRRYGSVPTLSESPTIVRAPVAVAAAFSSSRPTARNATVPAAASRSSVSVRRMAGVVDAGEKR